MEKKTSTEPLFPEFLKQMEAMPAEIIDHLSRVAQDEDEKNVISMFAPAFRNQFKELAGFMNEHSARASKQGMADVEQFLKVASPHLLMSNMKLALPSLGSIIGKFGIDGIVKEIKKIILEVLDLLGITVPKWISTIITLIDEILNDLLGGGSAKMKLALSGLERGYLGELTQLARLKKATRDLNTTDEEEEL